MYFTSGSPKIRKLAFSLGFGIEKPTFTLVPAGKSRLPLDA